MKKFSIICLITVFVFGCSSIQKKNQQDVIGKINKDIETVPTYSGVLTYYVCDNGNDTNDGLTEVTPLKSFALAIQLFNKAPTGSYVKLCRGGEFLLNSKVRLYNYNCDKDNPCYITDYISPTKPSVDAPIIKSEINDAILRFENPGNSIHDEGYVVSNLNVQGSGSNFAFIFYNDVDDVLFDNMVIENFSSAMYVATGNTPDPGSDKKNERIIISNSFLVNVKNEVLGEVDNVSLINIKQGKLASVDTDPISTSSSAVNIYYVCDNGSDTNIGDSPYQPLKTFEYSMSLFNSLDSGGAILFCRDGVFYSDAKTYIFNQNCTANDPCVIGDYISPTDEDRFRDNSNLPLVEIYGDVGGFKFQNPGNSVHDEGYIVKNLTLKSSSGAGVGISLFNDVDYLLIDNVEIDGFHIGVHSAVGNEPEVGSDRVNDFITLKNSRIINNSGMGWLGVCNECNILDNHFENNGYQGRNVFHNFYFGGHGEEFKSIVISGNYMTRSTIVDGRCSGTSFVVHGRVDGMEIKDNIIIEEIGKASENCWGISVVPGYADDEYFKNVNILNNIVTNVGNLAISCSTCIDLKIKNNKISQSQKFKSLGISVSSSSTKLLKTDNVEVSNNAIFFQSEQYGSEGIRIDFEGSLWEDNNAVIFF